MNYEKARRLAGFFMGMDYCLLFPLFLNIKFVSLHMIRCIFLSLLIISLSDSVLAQTIRVDSITIDENQSLLKVHGYLPGSPGSLSVNNKSLKLIQWSLTEGIFYLPYDGPGSSGPIKIISL